MSKLIDLRGRTFGYWTVLSKAPPRKGMTYWKCKCKCGNVRDIEAWGLKNGLSQSCGCFAREQTSKAKKTHGMSSSRLYSKWSHMKDRCYNPKVDRYSCYGGRGIIVCDLWKNSFLEFFTWATENGYKQELTLDRIDVNGNYCPENCRWITYKEQASNTRRNRYIDLQSGERVTLAELSRRTNIKRETLAQRLNKGWELAKVIKK